MNVLLITFSFPPAGGVGVLRALSLAKYLPETGLRVDVLTARNAPSVGTDLSLLRQVPAEVTVHRTWTLDLPFALRKLIKRLISGRSPRSGPAKQRGGAREDLPQEASATSRPPGPSATRPAGNPLKRLVGNLLLPDPQVGWLPFAFPAARRLIRQREIDVVLITVPPFSSVRLVASLRKLFPSLPIVLDFRDEWLTTTINLVSFNNNERARSIARQAEAAAVQHATAVVMVTEAARREIASRYPAEDPGKFRYIPNGFDTPSVPAPAIPGSVPVAQRPGSNGPVTLTYIGSVYGSTDPTTFVSAVQQLPAEARARLRLRFIGHIELAAYRELLQSLGATIELRGFLPQAEALKAISDTDYLLLITHDRINVAAKFYDYLGGSRPIVAAVHPDGDVRKLLEETQAGQWADVGDVGAIREMLLAVLQVTPADQAAAPSPRPDAAKIASFHRRAIAQRLAELLRALPRETR